MKIQVLDAVSGVPSWMYHDGKLYVDLPRDFSLEFFKSVSELSDLEKIKDEATIDVNLPHTPKNDLIFDFFRNHNRIGNTYQPISILLLEGQTVHNLTQLEVIQSDDPTRQYQVSIQRGEDHWLRKAKQTYLSTVNFGTFTLNPANLQSNWANNQYTDGTQGVYFPLVNYGGWFEQFTAVAEDFRPWLHATYVLQQAFCSMGWLFRSPWLETDAGRKIIAYILKENYGAAVIEAREFHAEGTFNGFGTVIFGTEVFDGSDSYDHTTGIYSGPGQHDFYAQLNIYDTNPSSTLAQYISVSIWKMDNGGIITSLADVLIRIPPGGNVSEDVKLEAKDVTLLPGEKIYVSSNTTSNSTITGKFYNETKGAFYTKGDVIDISGEISGEYTALDFLKGVAHLGNAKFVTDWANKTVWMYTPDDSVWHGDDVDGFYLDTIESMVGKLVKDSEVITLQKQAFKRYCRLQFANSSDAYIGSLDLPDSEPLYYKEIDRGTDYDEGTEVKSNPFFEPTANSLTDHFGTPAPLLSNPRLDLPCLWDNEEGKISYKIGPRIAFAHGEVEQVTDDDDTRYWKMEGGIKSDVPYASQLPGTKIDDGGPVDLTENLVYGEDDNDLYNLAWKSSLLTDSFSAKSAFFGLMTAGEYKQTHFRNRYLVVYRGRTWLARLLEIGGRKSCSDDPVNLVFKPIAYIGDTCDDAVFVPSDPCNNQPRIALEFDLDNDEITATADNSGIISTIDTDTWEYSVNDGETWSAYTPGTAIAGQPRIVFRRTVTFTDSCSDKVVTRTADVNAVCENSPSVVIDYNEGTNTISATGGGDFNSSIDTDTWTVDVDGGGASAYTPGTEISGFMSITFERTVTFLNSCPSVTVSQTFNVEGSQCNNVPELQFSETITGSCAYDLIIGGSTTSAIKFTHFQVSKDDGTTWMTWNRVPIRGESGTKARAIVYYDDDCPPSILEADCPT